jgi:hypothetical protein
VYLNIDHMPANAAALLQICKPWFCILIEQLNTASPDIIAKMGLANIQGLICGHKTHDWS